MFLRWGYLPGYLQLCCEILGGVGWCSCLGGALVSSAPTEIGWYTITWLVHDYLVGALETSAPPGRTRLPRYNNLIATQQQLDCHATATWLPRYGNVVGLVGALLFMWVRGMGKDAHTS